ncbi:UDP-glucose/GDP-mannose dehydrogenase family protein [Tianweitania sp. BSSL-BM11]|uniref:UDP-glucose 6-dehydrogenase n=2 Tax=Tianweitania aestuarii TaxID=2814886 RepID=A0ABS5RXV6_9HYPH|nr:UDP-glucose/GDP-mannose dehydrogenase family protein [Tianweitania aestuarii]MBS9721881.1 UDP-glucose/GDP-mannose dehydrogenase family protein [Tianweitania aestuarii]
MKITIIGAGYVGLTSGTCLAELGHHVTCIDMNEDRVARLRAGEVPIYEPGLQELMASNIQAGRLLFSADTVDGAADADAVFIAVGTPSLADGDIDLSFVQDAARGIARVIKPNCVVVVKSTVVVGTCKALREIIAEERGALDFSIASNPEFLREGTAVRDFLEPERVVFGSDDPRACAVLEQIYQPLADRGVTVMRTSNANAELIKYSANAFLALKIGFINDVANLCEQVGGDVSAVAAGIGLDTRIGSAFLSAGPGFGGSCFPKDTRAFAATGRKHDAPQGLIETLIEGNEARSRMLAERVLRELGSKANGATIAVLGLAFKANTDDIRDSPSLAIIPWLQKAGCRIKAHDPKAMTEAAKQLDDITFCDNAYDAARDADGVIVLTEWDEYRHLDLAKIAGTMRGALLADYRNLWLPSDMTDLDLTYLSIGRPTVSRASAAVQVAKPASRTVERAMTATSSAG